MEKSDHIVLQLITIGEHGSNYQRDKAWNCSHVTFVAQDCEHFKIS